MPSPIAARKKIAARIAVVLVRKLAAPRPVTKPPPPPPMPSAPPSDLWRRMSTIIEIADVM
jgi:hypothetical protein